MILKLIGKWQFSAYLVSTERRFNKRIGVYVGVRLDCDLST